MSNRVDSNGTEPNYQETERWTITITKLVKDQVEKKAYAKFGKKKACFQCI